MALVHNEPLRAYVLTLWVKIPSPTRNWRLARFRVLKLDASSNLDAYTASDHLPTYLLGPDGHSYSVEKTAWQKAIGTTKPRWDWLEEEVTHEEGSAHGIGYPGVVAGDVAFRDQPPATKLRRPEHEIFSLAMVGGGRIFGAAHPYVHPRLHNTLGVGHSPLPSDNMYVQTIRGTPSEKLLSWTSAEELAASTCSFGCTQS